MAHFLRLQTAAYLVFLKKMVIAISLGPLRGVVEADGERMLK
jgi:hypothetical protein